MSNAVERQPGWGTALLVLMITSFLWVVCWLAAFFTALELRPRQ